MLMKRKVFRFDKKTSKIEGQDRYIHKKSPSLLLTIGCDFAPKKNCPFWSLEAFLFGLGLPGFSPGIPSSFCFLFPKSILTKTSFFLLPPSAKNSGPKMPEPIENPNRT
jgi:hypothetical protein